MKRPTAPASAAYAPAAPASRPYRLRGRVESAVFNCPKCGSIVVWRTRKALWRGRCVCGLIFGVGLRVFEIARTRARRQPTEMILAPVPTAAPPHVIETDVTAAEIAGAAGRVESVPQIPLERWTPETPLHTTAPLHTTEPPDESVDFIASDRSCQ